MAFEKFRVGPDKGLFLAALDDVPDLMVVVGPNGAGKSTMLYRLQQEVNQQAQPGSRVLYLNPNRPWRRTDLNPAVIFNLPYSLNQLYEMPTFPGFQNFQPPGFQASGLQRSPDNPDETQSLVKFSVARLADQRRQAIADTYDKLGGKIPENHLPEIFGPLKEMVAELLPHLRFEGVTQVNNTLTCIFNKLDGATPMQVEIDNLSSGEKAIFQLLLPFVETQTEVLISGGAVDQSRSVIAIIDEPELHLHPALQVALLTYLRHMASKGRAQFIIATHSTAIMDACEEDELYLLAPPSTTSGGNQLMRLTSTNERLDTLRELTGSTYAVTRCRPIVYIEGQRQEATRDITDERLMEILVPASKGWVIVPAAGRADVIRLATALRDPTLTELPGMPVFALVDHDTGLGSHPDFVISWPVCMI